MFDYDDITQEDKKFVRDLIDRTTFNGNEKIEVKDVETMLKLKIQKCLFLTRELELIKNQEGQMVIKGEKMKMLLKKMKLQKK